MSQYTKTKAFFARAKDLLNTSRRLEDIFYAITKNNVSNIAAMYINEEGKIKKQKYYK